ncbi:MAG: pirin family protein [Pseudomonadota bacterium]
MSWNPTQAPDIDDSAALNALETLIVPRARDLGGFEVRRALPAPQRQMVGPFIFFDQMGPAEFITEGGIDVRPHPHIGLGTVTYLYQGEFQHRDSLGTDQMIYPGEVNWMLAGRGVTHSERTSPETRATRHKLFGIQTWVALPEDREDMAPDFEHHKADALPFLDAEGVEARLILGNAWGEQAPVTMQSEIFYADVTLKPGAQVPLPDEHEDRGAYITQGSVEQAGEVFEAGQMMVFRPGDRLSLRAGPEGARLMLLGGATLNGPRYMWWNFVSSSRDKIHEAKEAWKRADWQGGPFSLPPGDDAEFIPITPELDRLKPKAGPDETRSEAVDARA